MANKSSERKRRDIESDDPNTQRQDGRKKPNEIEKRPTDRVAGREEGNKNAPPTPTPDPAGGNL